MELRCIVPRFVRSAKRPGSSSHEQQSNPRDYFVAWSSGSRWSTSAWSTIFFREMTIFFLFLTIFSAATSKLPSLGGFVLHVMGNAKQAGPHVHAGRQRNSACRDSHLLYASSILISGKEMRHGPSGKHNRFPKNNRFKTWRKNMRK